MEKFITLFNYLSKDNLFKYYLPIFRVYIAFHILKKLFLNWGLISVVYSAYLSNKEENWFYYLLNTGFNDIPLFIYLSIALSIVYIFGIGGFTTVIGLIYCQLLTSRLFQGFANGGDNLLFFILIYLAFTNSNFYLSFSKYKDSSLRNFVSNLGVYSILLHLCLIYFVSGVHKIHSDVWFNGVATYYILNIDRFCSPLNHYFSNNAFIIAFTTYATILFEILFPFLIWVKGTRKLFLISGILMHLGIYFFMMIYDFEILFIMIYGFFVTNEEVKSILEYSKNKLRDSKIYCQFRKAIYLTI